MQRLNKAGYIPMGCTYQGHQRDGVYVHPEDYVRQRQEQSADMARLCGADTESAEDTVRRMRCLPGSEQQITRVVFGGGVLLLAALGVMALLAWVAR